MINPNELRLGNYVAVKNHGNEVIGKVFAISKDLVSVEGGNNNYDYHLLEPILLTEEILLKCEFKVADEYKLHSAYEPYIFVLDGIYIKFGSKYTDTPNEYYLYSIGNDNWSNEYVGNPIKSFHQLQNVIFDLCGKELNVPFE